MTADPIATAKILIVDDDPLNIILLETMLRDAGATQIISVADPRRVLLIYLEQRPDLLILDLMMPHLDGFAVMAGLKPHIPLNRYLPILMITADNNPDVRRRALAGGAADFLTKPFDEIETLLRVRNLIEIGQLQRQLQARIARDIHDGPLQDIGLLLLHIEMAQRLLKMGETARAEDKLGELREEVRGLLGQWRGVVSEMRPQALASGGLSAALRDLAARLSSESGSEVEVDVQLHDKPSAALETLIYRLAQESFSNIRKHSAASNVWLALAQVGDHLTLSIRDDGRGFDVQTRMRQALAGGHVGLAGLYERASNAGGTLQVSSTPGAGASLEFTLPFSSATAADPAPVGPTQSRNPA